MEKQIEPETDLEKLIKQAGDNALKRLIEEQKSDKK